MDVREACIDDLSELISFAIVILEFVLVIVAILHSPLLILVCFVQGSFGAKTVGHCIELSRAIKAPIDRNSGPKFLFWAMLHC